MLTVFSEIKIFYLHLHDAKYFLAKFYQDCLRRLVMVKDRCTKNDGI